MVLATTQVTAVMGTHLQESLRKPTELLCWEGSNYFFPIVFRTAVVHKGSPWWAAFKLFMVRVIFNFFIFFKMRWDWLAWILHLLLFFFEKLNRWPMNYKKEDPLLFSVHGHGAWWGRSVPPAVCWLAGKVIWPYLKRKVGTQEEEITIAKLGAWVLLSELVAERNKKEASSRWMRKMLEGFQWWSQYCEAR